MGGEKLELPRVPAGHMDASLGQDRTQAFCTPHRDNLCKGLGSEVFGMVSSAKAFFLALEHQPLLTFFLSPWLPFLRLYFPSFLLIVTAYSVSDLVLPVLFVPTASGLSSLGP